MYIYNTTFAVAEAIIDEWIDYMKEQAIKPLSEAYTGVRYSRLQIETQEGYASFALQFEVNNIEQLKAWQLIDEKLLLESLSQKYSDKVLHFSTLMKIID